MTMKVNLKSIKCTGLLEFVFRGFACGLPGNWFNIIIAISQAVIIIFLRTNSILSFLVIFLPFLVDQVSHPIEIIHNFLNLPLQKNKSKQCEMKAMNYIILNLRVTYDHANELIRAPVSFLRNKIHYF